MRSATIARPSATTAPRRRRRLWPLLGVGVAALLVGLSVGRFLTYEPGPAASPAPAAAGSLSERMSALERQVAQNPDDVAGWQQLGITAVLRASESGDPAFYLLAERAFDRADDLVPGDAATVVGRGSLALALHDFDTALALGRRAVQALPGNSTALGIVVDAEVELGRYDAAARTLQDMLDMSPDLPALARVSYLRQLRGDLPGASQAMRQAGLAGSPAPFDQASVLALQGDLHLIGGDTPAALAAYEEALRGVPGLIGGEIGMARVEAISGDLAAAVTRLEALVARIPHPGAARLLGELQLAVGDPTAAAQTDDIVRSLARLQEAQGQDVDLEMALFEADRGADPERAVRLARRAYELRPRNVFTADALGWALHRAGRSDAAVRYARQAVRLGSADPLLHYHAASIWAGAGRPGRAADALRDAIALTPWVTFSAVDDARALAVELGVDVPEAWLPR